LLILGAILLYGLTPYNPQILPFWASISYIAIWFGLTIYTIS
jgi:hypothetical protein